MNRNILTFLNEYAEIPDPQYAIMLRGAWGCGKTFDHYPANHRTNQQGNIPVAVQQGNETCQEYIKSRFENRFEIRY